MVMTSDNLDWLDEIIAGIDARYTKSKLRSENPVPNPSYAADPNRFLSNEGRKR
jgi:hypothetical protein